MVPGNKRNKIFSEEIDTKSKTAFVMGRVEVNETWAIKKKVNEARWLI